jgi:hypothetical protein
MPSRVHTVCLPPTVSRPSRSNALQKHHTRYPKFIKVHFARAPCRESANSCALVVTTSSCWTDRCTISKSTPDQMYAVGVCHGEWAQSAIGLRSSLHSPGNGWPLPTAATRLWLCNGHVMHAAPLRHCRSNGHPYATRLGRRCIRGTLATVFAP